MIFIIVKCTGKKKIKDNIGLKIDKTENVIVEIKKLGEFVTASYYEEMVLHYAKKSTKVLDKSKDELVMLAKGKVRAGFDLKEVSEEDIIVRNDTVEMNVPPVKIIDVIINPSDFEIYEEDGKWSQSLITSIQSEARKKLKTHALTNNILDKAKQMGRNRLEEILKGLEFPLKKVISLMIAVGIIF